MRNPRRDVVGTAMEEVAGKAAFLVDPLDVSAIAEGMRTAVARRDDLVPLGLERASCSRGNARRTTGRALAGARVKVVVFDADVLGRQRTGDETMR